MDKRLDFGTFNFGAKGSEEHRKLSAALDAAENRKKKLKEDVEALKEIVRMLMC